MGRSKHLALALFLGLLAWGCGASDESGNSGGNGGSSTVDAGDDLRLAPGSDLGGSDATSEVGPIDGEDCTNTLDDDGDGQVDCGDSDCIGHEACGGDDFEVICDDTLDDDGDGKIDCDDEDCATAPNCDDGPIITGPEICTGGVDEDGDTLIDCNDGDCAADPACAATTAEDCFNSIDDDGDGLRDCEDPDCERACGGGGGGGGGDDPLCMIICMLDPSGLGFCDCGGGGGGGEDCTNGTDDNGDGAADCDDLLCMMDPACM